MEGIWGGAFFDCANMTAITVENSNPYYSSVDGVLFDKSMNILIQCPGGRAGSYAVPNGVTIIGGDAFFDCVSLTNITIPNSVASLSDWAFQSCYNLNAVYFKGNIPSLGGSDVFYGDNRATVYYLPGTTGWGTTFGGLPAMLCNLHVQTGDASFGVRTNRFGFTITGTTNIPIVVEACTNLANASWLPMQGCALTNGSLYFSDRGWTNYLSRFYRIRSP